MIRFATTAIVLSLAAAPAFAEPVQYTFDKSHSNLSFSYNHLNYSITDGRFGDWDATLMIDADEPANSSVEFVIDADSLDTFWEARDEHFKSADFFDVAEYPEVTFKSTSVEQVSENKLEVTGDLTIKDITKPAVLEVDIMSFGEHPMAEKQAAGFNMKTVVKRSDYGMDMYVPYISDEVDVVFSGEAMIAE
ncbi:YceI family protein [Martelella mediterranea]|uniref:Polyisoprenoid-binding protein YceI n=1 Tax=Martelella mediterranea TaxID=293089 RepID=A0A4R3NX15_9HYPH|nr:YceI family protein [Martelella mediterranea]TCT42888.1 polyisoprenoid-binding protein YceI [Martelella mediterranea]